MSSVSICDYYLRLTPAASNTFLVFPLFSNAPRFRRILVGTTPTRSEPEEIPDVERWIKRQEQAARLAVAAEILGRHPELQAYKRQADEYLATVYGRVAETSDESREGNIRE